MCLPVSAVAGAEELIRANVSKEVFPIVGDKQKHLYVEHMVEPPVNTRADGNYLRVVLHLGK